MEIRAPKVWTTALILFLPLICIVVNSDSTGETDSQPLDDRLERIYNTQIALKEAEIEFLKERLVSQSQELSRVKQELVEESARLLEARQTLRDQTLVLSLAGGNRTAESQAQEARRFQERLDALEKFFND
ncbi:hypothetical protein RhiLY_09293 [Ceratobasidium sp. AG-Ba]|nr:hypothetical protein RhiLY_09293 [Ceratobasidium sp. AG-Ba]